MSRPALLDKLFQAGKWLLKPGLVPIDDVTIKRNQTIVYVALDALIRQGGGLAVGQDKRIYVDFSLMPTDAFEDLLKSIRVPVWLTKSTNFYVDGSAGSDTLDDGRGLSEKKAFKTIQATVNYVCDTYNLNRYNAVINVSKGTYNEKISLGSYTTTTGRVYINGIDKESTIITGESYNSSTIRIAGGNWTLQHLGIKHTIINGDYNFGTIASVVKVEGGDDSMIHDCSLYEEYTELSMPYERTQRMLWVSNGNMTCGSLSIKNMKGLRQAFFAVASSNTAKLAFIGSNTEQRFCELNGDFDIVVTAFSGAAVTFNNNNAQHRYYLTVAPDGHVTGKRYEAKSGGTISVAGDGPEFIPGTIEGSVEAETYSWYK